MLNNGGIADLLAKDVYVKQALVPASPWLNDTPPGKPELRMSQDSVSGQIRLYWKPTGKQKIRLWVLQMKKGREWTTNILPGTQSSFTVSENQVENLVVSGVSQYGIQGAIAVADVRENKIKL